VGALWRASRRSGAGGKLHATFFTGGELTFWGHHANRIAAASWNPLG
jgi:hypothetical protein